MLQRIPSVNEQKTDIPISHLKSIQNKMFIEKEYLT